MNHLETHMILAFDTVDSPWSDLLHLIFRTPFFLIALPLYSLFTLRHTCWFLLSPWSFNVEVFQDSVIASGIFLSTLPLFMISSGLMALNSIYMLMISKCISPNRTSLLNFKSIVLTTYLKCLIDILSLTCPKLWFCHYHPSPHFNSGCTWMVKI